MTARTTTVPSPESTGGAGPNFEQQTGAYWLSLLLVGGIPPVLCQSTVVGVAFQANRLGWSTDDFLITTDDGSRTRRLLVQAKRTFAVSDSDSECVAAFTDFWTDFSNPSFRRNDDQLLLVVLRGTNVLLDHFGGLLEQARVARSSTEFATRLTTKGLVHATSARYFELVKSIVSTVLGRPPDEDELWSFIRHIHVLSLDLGTSTRQTETVITTLLALNATARDPVERARATWRHLLQLAGEDAGRAAEFRREYLPADLRAAHSPVSTQSTQALRALQAHGDVILGTLRDSIGAAHLPRIEVVQSLLDTLQTSQFVLVSGPAGVGKSGIAKAAFKRLSTNHFTFAFRAEEFARAHLDETLAAGQLSLTTSALSALMAGQTRKVILIDSTERLLEHGTRDAFSDLIALAAADPSWRVVLTCRDYSKDLVASAFLEGRGVAWTSVAVPDLADEELDAALAENPVLARPLASKPLRDLLRNPYFLDKACRVAWSSETDLPKDKSEFRKLFWKEVVRREDQLRGGMPARRAQFLIDIARERAQTLQLYANCEGLHADARDSLRVDSLISVSPDSEHLCAPAHDVLEDWAIMAWLADRFAIYHQSLKRLSEDVGMFPALRRTYRTWVAEQVELTPSVADAFFLECIADESIPAYFRDDTLVSILRAKDSGAWLRRHEAFLFGDGQAVLRRVIHLLRVACVELRTLPGAATTDPTWNVPEGVAWGAMLDMLARNVAHIGRHDHDLVLGIITDWARLVSASTPYPPGASAAALLGHHLLTSFGEYGDDDRRDRALRVIAKLPLMMQTEFVRLLTGTADNRSERPVHEAFQKIVLFSLDGIAACRDIPGAVRATARDAILLLDDELGPDEIYGHHPDMEHFFGLKDKFHWGTSSESAWQGPFLFLLRSHPRDAGIPLILELVNHTTGWYAQPRHVDRLEEPIQIVLRFGDGSERRQCASARLWNLYRGTSVGPAFLKSALMALEKFLFEAAAIPDLDLDGLLLSLMRRSDSISVTAVAASLAVAYPHRCPEVLLTLLRCRQCISLDRARMVQDYNPPSSWGFGGLRDDLMGELGEQERRETDAMAHRKNDIEHAILTLQLGPKFSEVQFELDAAQRRLPGLDQQSEDDRLWRLSLHRMDLRRYEPKHVDEPPTLAAPEATTPSPTMILLNPVAPESDLQQRVDDAAAKAAKQQKWLTLLNWGLGVFRGEGNADPSAWRTSLSAARAVDEDLEDVPDDERGFRGGPRFVAAICVRDHWEEMGADEQHWCVEAVCSAVEEHADDWAYFERVQLGAWSPDRSCAFVVWGLIAKLAGWPEQDRARAAAVLGLTHAIDEVRVYAAHGAGRFGWSTDRDFVVKCVEALELQANLVAVAHTAALKKRRTGNSEVVLDDIEHSAAVIIRELLNGSDSIPRDRLTGLDLREWFGAKAGKQIAAILREAPDEPTSRIFFIRMAESVVAGWDEDRRDSGRSNRNYQDEQAMEEALQRFILRAPLDLAREIAASLVRATGSHPREAARFVEGLIYRQDQLADTENFWLIWAGFAEAVLQSLWVAWLDERHGSGDEIIRAMFLGIRWKEGLESWHGVVGHEYCPRRLFEQLPPSRVVLTNYVRFLYKVGKTALPGAFVSLATCLRAAPDRDLLSESNGVYMLECLLRRWVYGRPLELKRDPVTRDAVMHLLDALVDAGSSTAFRMRDDFVTPLSNAS